MRLRRLWDGIPVAGGRWTVRDVVQGRPLGHPSHPFLSHFPMALPVAALALDVASRLRDDPALPRAAYYNQVIALSVLVPTALTGLVDYLTMVPGSRKRRLATYHLLSQVTAAGLFALSLVLRAARPGGRTAPAPLALQALGCLALMLGGYLGGTLVYRQGMRVSVEP